MREIFNPHSMLHLLETGMNALVVYLEKMYESNKVNRNGIETLLGCSEIKTPVMSLDTRHKERRRPVRRYDSYER